MRDRVSGVYLIRNTVNGRLYVGSSVNLYERHNRHFNELRKTIHRNSRLQSDFNLHGCSAFIFEELERCMPNDLPLREKYYMDKLDVLDPVKGYNIMLEPYKGIIPEDVRKLISQKAIGRRHSESTKKKIGNFHRGKVMSAETRTKMSQFQTGQTKSVECREKCRLAHLGTKKTKEARTRMSANRPGKKAVICFDDDRNMMACFESIGEAAREMGIPKKSIQQVCRKLKQHTGGLCWQYANN